MGHWEENGKSDEWYTPQYIFDELAVIFDLDVAAPEAKTFVPARQFITGNSLACEWSGFVWMNPPFGGRNSLVPWMNKFFEHGDGIALTPDRTSAPWFQASWQKAFFVLFLPKVRFVRPDGSEGKSPSTGSALWASGFKAELALQNAAKRGFGIGAIPVRQIG